MSLAARMAFHDAPAVSIALINNGRIEWARAYGVLDAASQLPATPASLFQAGSISKSISALCALHPVEQSKLSLDSPANGQLSSWKIPDNHFIQQSPVTLRGLLNHSAGMNVHGFYGYAQGQPVPTLLQVLDGVAPANSEPVRVEATPGTEWKYSGEGLQRCPAGDDRSGREAVSRVDAGVGPWPAGHEGQHLRHDSGADVAGTGRPRP